jgi:hypothetical protein
MKELSPRAGEIGWEREPEDDLSLLTNGGWTRDSLCRPAGFAAGVNGTVFRHAETHNVRLSTSGSVGDGDESQETAIPCTSTDRVIQYMMRRYRVVESLMLSLGLEVCLYSGEETCAGSLESVNRFVFFVEEVIDSSVKAGIFG